MGLSKKKSDAGIRSVANTEQHKSAADVMKTGLEQPESIPQISVGKSFGSIPLYSNEGMIQTKLAVNKPGDQYEQQADAVASKIIQSNNDDSHPQLSTSITPVVQAKGDPSGLGSESLNNKIGSSKGNGASLDEETQSFMTSRFGVDFSSVKIHADDESAAMNTEVNAKAFTSGNDIYFNKGQFKPQTQEGKQLLAHELTHTVQQRSGSQSIQRFAPEDVSSEMIGREFTLLEDQMATDGKTNIPKGTTITITAWGNADHVVTATAPVASKTYTVKPDKKHIKPVGSAAVGLKQYTMGVSGAQTAIGKGDAKIATHKSKEPEYKKYKNDKGYATELARLEGEQNVRYDSLNTNLIQETMVNRFDADIVKWVDHYNTTLKPKTNLDSNVVKSMLYQETKMGTRGVHLEKPPYGWTGATSYPIKSRFNLGQAIDSWGPQQYLMIKELSPTIYAKYKLADLEKDGKWKGMSNSDYAAWNSGAFINAMIEYNAARSGGKNLNATSTEDLMLDYSYWIRVAVRWLFTKYFSLKTPDWSEAVKAYNGSGGAADQYKKDVMSRVP